MPGGERASARCSSRPSRDPPRKSGGARSRAGGRRRGQPARRKPGDVFLVRLGTLDAPACRISIAGCLSMPAISKLRMTDAGGSRSISERFARVRARPRRACNPALSTRMSSARSRRNSSSGANALTASVNRGAVEKSRSPARRMLLASASGSISSPDATRRTFPDSALRKRARDEALPALLIPVEDHPHPV